MPSCTTIVIVPYFKSFKILLTSFKQVSTAFSLFSEDVIILLLTLPICLVGFVFTNIISIHFHLSIEIWNLEYFYTFNCVNRFFYIVITMGRGYKHCLKLTRCNINSLLRHLGKIICKSLCV